MGKTLLAAALLLSTITAFAQATFNGGWHLYTTGTIIHNYTYNYIFQDSFKINLIDSTEIFSTPDSMVTLTINYALREKAIYKTTDYMGIHKLPVKSEQYKGNAMTEVEEWKYDAKDRVIFHSELNKLNDKLYTKRYEYEADKTTGGTVILESAYYNNKIEFYTKDYYDKKNIHIKQLRLNDNKIDVIHIETYKYNEKGKLKERSVYFPEFRVTKKFDEGLEDMPEKCAKTTPILPIERITQKTKEAFVKKLLVKNSAILFDKDCFNASLKFVNGPGYDATITKSSKERKHSVLLRIKEHLK